MAYTIIAEYISGNIQINNKRNPYDYKKRVSYLVDTPYNAAEAEQALWRAVITQAILDALTCNRKDRYLHYKQDAIEWLMQGDDDFHDVCERAGLEPYFVRKKAKRAMIAPPVFRADAGESDQFIRRKKIRHRHQQHKQGVAEDFQQMADKGCVLTQLFA